VSIVRIGLAETKNFGDGYDAIFGKKKTTTAKPAKKAATVRRAKAKLDNKPVKPRKKK
jgi:hypothetical protein